MKANTILILCAFCICFTGCKSKIAMDYNEMIVKKQQTLSENMDQAEPGLRSYFTNFQYDSIVAVSAAMEVKIDSITNDIKKRPTPAVKQGENFKKAALQYFSNMKSIYTSYKNYGLQTTPQGRQTQQQIMSLVIAQEDKMISDMREAQRIFAKDNGFKIQMEKKSDDKSLTASPASK